MVNVINRRQFLKTSVLGAGSLFFPKIANAKSLLGDRKPEDILRALEKFFLKEENQKKDKKTITSTEKINIPFDTPYYFTADTDYETISIERGVAKMKWRSSSNFREAKETKNKDKYTVLTRLSKTDALRRSGRPYQEITVYRLEAFIDGYKDTSIREKLNYPRDVKFMRNINCSESSIWVAHLLKSVGVDKYIRTLPMKQKFLTVRKKEGEFINQWEEGIAFNDDPKAMLMFKLGEKTLDSFLAAAFPKNQKQMKKALEKLVEWCAHQRDTYYQDTAKEFDNDFFANQIGIYHPSITKFTQEGMDLKFGVWDPGKKSKIRVFGDIYIGNPSISTHNQNYAGGYVENWKLVEGEPVFSIN